MLNCDNKTCTHNRGGCQLVEKLRNAEPIGLCDRQDCVYNVSSCMNNGGFCNLEDPDNCNEFEPICDKMIIPAEALNKQMARWMKDSKEG